MGSFAVAPLIAVLGAPRPSTDTPEGLVEDGVANDIAEVLGDPGFRRRSTSWSRSSIATSWLRTAPRSSPKVSRRCSPGWTPRTTSSAGAASRAWRSPASSVRARCRGSPRRWGQRRRQSRARRACGPAARPPGPAAPRRPRPSGRRTHPASGCERRRCTPVTNSRQCSKRRSRWRSPKTGTARNAARRSGCSAARSARAPEASGERSATPAQPARMAVPGAREAVLMGLFSKRAANITRGPGRAGAVDGRRVREGQLRRDLAAPALARARRPNADTSDRTWFWLNAYPALSALRTEGPGHPLISTCAGYADQVHRQLGPDEARRQR